MRQNVRAYSEAVHPPNGEKYMTLQIGFLLFPQVQQLDLTGPYDVLASLPGV